MEEERITKKKNGKSQKSSNQVGGGWVFGEWVVWLQFFITCYRHPTFPGCSLQNLVYGITCF
jgi:hypothetical protein